MVLLTMVTALAAAAAPWSALLLGAVPLDTTSHISERDRGRSPYAADANSIWCGFVFEMALKVQNRLKTVHLFFTSWGKVLVQ